MKLTIVAAHQLCSMIIVALDCIQWQEKNWELPLIDGKRRLVLRVGNGNT
jgi:hypothetical protein